ncbi:MAG: hypothetical protein IKP23_05455 [Elusimicrobiaceae bacterium]|jgi:hypothetical protein|nr:hypothetical protein [Elusimicrobiaceae bacterium]
MSKFLNSFKVSFSKGIHIGILDIIFRIVIAVIWVLVVKLLISFVWEAITLPQLTGQRLWWLAYSALAFVIVSVLGYSAVINRE